MRRGRYWRRVLVGAGLATALLSGCAAPAYQAPEELSGSDPSTSGPVAQLDELLNELASGFGTKSTDGADLIDGDTTIEVAVSQLQDSIGFSDQVGATAAAWGQYWRDQVPVQQVDIDVSEARVLGTWDGDPLAQVSVQVTSEEVPGQEDSTEFEYGVSWADGELQWVGPVADVDGEMMVDTGAGLASPTGAAQRYLELVGQGDWDAVARFSAGANTNATELEVLASVTDAAKETRLVALPIRDDDIWTVYAVTGVHHVIAHFDVDVDSTTVVYRPTV